MASYTVSGVTSAQYHDMTYFNGDYAEYGTFNGKPTYKQTLTDFQHKFIGIFWNGSKWCLTGDVTAGSPTATFTGNSTSPLSSDGAYTMVSGKGPPDTTMPTVTGDAPADTTAPVVNNANINAAGTTLTINWTETGSAPVTGTTGLSLVGMAHGAATLSGVSTTGTTTTATISRAITSDETITLSYTPGNFGDSASPANTVVAFSGKAITNNSTQTPTIKPLVLIDGRIQSLPDGYTLTDSSGNPYTT